jgi:DNA-binding NtrC family response regulator
MTDIEELQNYDWPGNVRELRNVIERAVVASRLGTLRFDVPKADAAAVAQGSAATGTPAAGGVLTDDEVRRIERDNTLAALKRSDWKVYGEGGAAELLGIKPTTLKSRMQKMGLQRRGSEATAAAEDEPMRRAARGNSLGDVVKEHILRVLEHNDGNKSKTARDLGIDPKTLYKRLREYGILPPSE